MTNKLLLAAIAFGLLGQCCDLVGSTSATQSDQLAGSVQQIAEELRQLGEHGDKCLKARDTKLEVARNGQSGTLSWAAIDTAFANAQRYFVELVPTTPQVFATAANITSSCLNRTSSSTPHGW